jgi:50S ribosomal protein L16 3-hydroxylase
MVRGAGKFLRRIRWSSADVARFLGCHLTEPKAHVVFPRPRRPLPLRSFAAGAARRGVRLAAQTRMLFHGRTLFINGEAVPAGAAAARLLSRLADRRSLPPQPRIGREAAQHLYLWYRAGYIILSDE